MAELSVLAHCPVAAVLEGDGLAEYALEGLLVAILILAGEVEYCLSHVLPAVIAEFGAGTDVSMRVPGIFEAGAEEKH